MEVKFQVLPLGIDAWSIASRTGFSRVPLALHKPMMVVQVASNGCIDYLNAHLHANT
jgi:hypothetical protein